jgi:glutamyl-Q tRNA(Asp) synthetase
MSARAVVSASHATRATRIYRGRFAPSPTGPLHAGSLVAALASWLDARAHGGAWLVRIEDIDPPRELPGAAQDILATLADFGLESDEPVQFQSSRSAAYQQAFEQLRAAGQVYGCTCSRKEIDAAIEQTPGWPAGVYPGTCRARASAREEVCAWRLRVPDGRIGFTDRHAGVCPQDVARAVGDFVLRRADGLWAYQLAVVVDDAAQGITDVVRGADLLDNTPRQIVLQRALGLATPRYLHVRVVVNETGEKLSKQTGARALDRHAPLAELGRAASHLRLPAIGADSVPAFLQAATRAWAEFHARTDTMILGDRTDGR